MIAPRGVRSSPFSFAEVDVGFKAKPNSLISGAFSYRYCSEAELKR